MSWLSDMVHNASVISPELLRKWMRKDSRMKIPTTLRDILRGNVPGVSVVGYGVSAKGNASLEVRGQKFHQRRIVTTRSLSMV